MVLEKCHDETHADMFVVISFFRVLNSRIAKRGATTLLYKTLHLVSDVFVDAQQN